VRSVAEAFNKRVIVVRTNVKDHLLRYTHWDFSHRAALASVALCLEGSISKCIIASTCSYAELHPWGSHPILDPLWSTESLQFLHDGTEALRVDKLPLIADSKLAMKYLRACDNPSSSGHCGECEKCLRTMVGLHVIGRLADCPLCCRFRRVAWAFRDNFARVRRLAGVSILGVGWVAVNSLALLRRRTKKAAQLTPP
jgi:hypothetical protein